MRKKRIVVGIVTVASGAAIGIWTVLASHLFVWAGGLSKFFPSPWTTWWRYARHPVIDNITLAYLVGSGILATLPFALIGMAMWRMRRRGMEDKREVFGKTDWSDANKMRSNGVTTKRRPF